MKAGFNHSGSQRYKCGECKRAYTPAAKEKGYAKETRMLALRMYVEGNSPDLEDQPSKCVELGQRLRSQTTTCIDAPKAIRLLLQPTSVDET